MAAYGVTVTCLIIRRSRSTNDFWSLVVKFSRRLTLQNEIWQMNHPLASRLWLFFFFLAQIPTFLLSLRFKRSWEIYYLTARCTNKRGLFPKIKLRLNAILQIYRVFFSYLQPSDKKKSLEQKLNGARCTVGIDKKNFEDCLYFIARSGSPWMKTNGNT